MLSFQMSIQKPGSKLALMYVYNECWVEIIPEVFDTFLLIASWNCNYFFLCTGRRHSLSN